MKIKDSYKKTFTLEDLVKNKKQIKEFYRAYGFIHMKSFFSRQEIIELKKLINYKGVKYDTIDYRISNNIFISKKIYSLLSIVIKGKIIYPFLSKIIENKQSQQGKSLYHVDTRNDDYNFNKDYDVVNTGVYFNNYKDNSGGLKISPGSQRTRDFEDFTFIGRCKKHIRNKQFLKMFLFQKSYNLPLELGDFVLWNVRTHHSGHVRLIKFLKKVSLHPVFENMLPKFLFLSQEKNRKIIVTLYAEECKYYDKYLDYQLKTKSIEHWKNTCILGEQIALSKKNNFELDKRCLDLMKIIN